MVKSHYLPFCIHSLWLNKVLVVKFFLAVKYISSLVKMSIFTVIMKKLCYVDIYYSNSFVLIFCWIDSTVSQHLDLFLLPTINLSLSLYLKFYGRGRMFTPQQPPLYRNSFQNTPSRNSFQNTPSRNSFQNTPSRSSFQNTPSRSSFQSPARNSLRGSQNQVQ